jgi:hypothetical protein
LQNYSWMSLTSHMHKIEEKHTLYITIGVIQYKDVFSNLARYHLACFLVESNNIINIFHISFDLTFDQAKQLLQNIEITSMKLVQITKNMNSSSTNTKDIQNFKMFSLRAKILVGTIRNHLDKITRKLDLI